LHSLHWWRNARRSQQFRQSIASIELLSTIGNLNVNAIRTCLALRAFAPVTASAAFCTNPA
jgi:hypothetical protein